MRQIGKIIFWCGLVYAVVVSCHAADELPLSIATSEYPHIEEIRNGTIKIPECRISYSTFSLTELQGRFERGAVGDVIEVDFLESLRRYSADAKHDWILVPVFLWREFPQRHLMRRVDVPPHPQAPSVNRLAVDTNLDSMLVWARGVFESSPTLPTGSFVWDETIASSPTLLSPLYPDFRIPEEDYFKSTRIFPIMTVLAVRSELVKANPWLPEALFIAFSEAKSQALEAGTIPLPWGPAYRDQTIALMKKNYWSYGVKNNPRTLDALFKYAHEQGITAKVLTAEDVFAPETLQLIDEKGAKN